MRYHEKLIRVSISFGIASMTDREARSPESLMRLADAMLYSTKKDKKSG